jgi:hypothetical protein
VPEMVVQRCLNVPNQCVVRILCKQSTM